MTALNCVLQKNVSLCLLLNNIKNMDLKEFITETLVQITEGVQSAQEKIKNTGCLINPEGFHQGENLKHGYNGKYRHVQKVKMSIAVNVIENSETKAGLGVVTTILSAGLSNKAGETNTSTNKVEFDIPISLPIMNIKQED